MRDRFRLGGGFAGVALAAALALTGCGGDGGEKPATQTVSQAPGSATPTDAATQIDAAQATLAEIVDRDRHDTSYHVDGIRSDPTVSPAFISGIDVATQEAKQAGATGLDFDPILCAQNLPRRVHYRAGAPMDGVLRIDGIFDYGAGKPVRVIYSMVLDGGIWKLNGTDCLEQAVGGEQ
jgi:hypothetical protein